MGSMRRARRGGRPSSSLRTPPFAHLLVLPFLLLLLGLDWQPVIAWVVPSSSYHSLSWRSNPWFSARVTRRVAATVMMDGSIEKESEYNRYKKVEKEVATR